MVDEDKLFEAAIIEGAANPANYAKHKDVRVDDIWRKETPKHMTRSC
jgi:hypothetical protein